MQVYLPIAEMSVDAFVLLSLGAVTGVLSGMFGVGGGFLMTPLLIFIGVPPSVAVSSSANQIIASSFSGFLAHLRRQNVDFRMGNLLLLGGLVGSSAGISLFVWLQKTGQIDLAISLSYVLFLGTIGTMMAMESARAILHKKRGTVSPKSDKLNFLQQLKLPMVMYFPRSKLHVSALLPLGIGAVVGVLVSLMGIGGGFFIIPAMIYILGMPTSVVIGTSLYQIIFITANVTFLQAINTHTVDIILALFLLSGSVVGAQIGSRMGTKLPPEYLRALLAAMVLVVVLRLAYGLFITPTDLYQVITIEKP